MEQTPTTAPSKRQPVLALNEAKSIIRILMNELDGNHFGAIHTLNPQHPNRAAYDRAAEFLKDSDRT